MFKIKLKDLRMSLKMTQQEFADLCGFTRTAITELESGRRKPSLKTIKKICNATNTKLIDWINDDIDLDAFESSKILIDYLIETDHFDNNYDLSDKDNKLLIDMFLRDVKYYASKKKAV